MPVRLRNGGAWYTVPNGNLRVRYGGIWHVANHCYIRSNAPGNVNGWYDSGYRGLPAAPANFGVYSWDYNNVAVQWSAGSGGSAPASGYQIVMTGPNGNPNNTNDWVNHADNVSINASPWGYFGVNWDNRYKLYIRAQTDATQGAVYSAWTGPIQIGIGHPQQDTYGPVQHQRAWDSQVFGGGDGSFLAGNQWWGFNLDGNHYIDSYHWRNLMLDGSQIVQVSGSGSTARWVSWFLDSAWQDGGAPGGAILGGARIDRTSYFNYDGGFGSGVGWWGDGNVWGMGPRGAGWAAPGGNQAFMLWCAAFWFSGQELYVSNDVVSSIPASGNYYW